MGRWLLCTRDRRGPGASIHDRPDEILRSWKQRSLDLPCPTVNQNGLGNVGGYEAAGVFLIYDKTTTDRPRRTKAKPPYRVPSMREIAKTKRNGFRIISTFSGCGGSCLGFEMAGFKVLWASEFVDAAREVYKLNHPGVPVDPRDIRKIDPKEILKAAGVKRGEIDILEGSPPCASFSTAGNKEIDWGKVKKYSDVKQRTDDLFSEYARILDGLQPKIFVAENVSGLVKGVAKGYFKMILAELKACGYKVEARLLDAQWLGVPQARQRLIFIGVRNDLTADPRFPTPLSYRYNVTDAIPNVSQQKRNLGFHQKSVWMDASRNPSQTIQSKHSYRRKEDNPYYVSVKRFAIGKELEKLQEGKSSDKYFNLVRSHRRKPSPTVTATGGILGAASVTHPVEIRKFTIPELRRICAFPDDFKLTGTYSQQWERLGRAVPPLMMRQIAIALRDVLADLK